MDRLDAPALGDEAAGQPVEQLGMARRLGPHAEIAGSADQPLAEMVHPDPIDPDAGGQWIARIDDRPGQFEPSAPLGERLAVGAGDDLEEPARNLVARVGRIPSPEDPGLVTIGAIDDDHRVGRRLRGLDQPAVDLALKFPELDDRAGVEVPLRGDDRLVGHLAGRIVRGVQDPPDRLVVRVRQVRSRPATAFRASCHWRSIAGEQLAVPVGGLADRRGRLGEAPGHAGGSTGRPPGGRLARSPPPPWLRIRPRSSAGEVGARGGRSGRPPWPACPGSRAIGGRSPGIRSFSLRTVSKPSGEPWTCQAGRAGSRPRATRTRRDASSRLAAMPSRSASRRLFSSFSNAS